MSASNFSWLYCVCPYYDAGIRDLTVNQDSPTKPLMNCTLQVAEAPNKNVLLVAVWFLMKWPFENISNGTERKFVATDNDNDCVPVETEALVFMVVALNGSWSASEYCSFLTAYHHNWTRQCHSRCMFWKNVILKLCTIR